MLFRAGPTRQFAAGFRTCTPPAAARGAIADIRISYVGEKKKKKTNMVRTKEGDGITSNLIIAEVKKRPCLFDTSDVNYGDRAEKSRCWQEVCNNVVPGWSMLSQLQKLTAGKEVQKRWRSIRDAYTKMYRQGKCVLPEQCKPGSKRYQYHRDLAFLRKALQNKARYSQDIYESLSEVSNSPQHPQPEDVRPKIEITEKPLDLKTKPDLPEKPETMDKGNQACTIEKPNSLEIKIDANSILPDDHFDDDRSFMNSLIPLFKKMDDDTRLLCRIEVLKIIRYALQGHKCFEALKMAEDSFFKDRMSGILAKEEVVDTPKSSPKSTDSRLSMTTRSADGSRPVRKRRPRSPSPLPVPAKRRGPGRPRKIRPPPSDSEEEQLAKKKCPKLKVAPVEVSHNASTEMDESLSKATSVDQLTRPMFMKMYNLTPTKFPAGNQTQQNNIQVSIKTEPVDREPYQSNF